MGLFKRGNLWWLSYTFRGQRHFVSTKQRTRSRADTWRDAFMAKVKSGEVDLGRQRDETLGDILRRYLRVHVSPNRPGSYERTFHVVKRMIAAFGWTFPAVSVRTKIDDYKAWRKSQVKPGSVNREIVILKAALSKGVEWQMIPRNPLDGYRLDRVDDERVRYIEDVEFERLVNAAHPDMALLFLMARHMGMRQGEILKLQWTDVDLRSGTVCIRQSKSGKGRYIPMTSGIRAHLEAVPLSARIGYVLKHNGRPLNRLGFVLMEFRKAIRISGIINFRFHDLRHTWASHAAMRGIDAQSLAAILGHKTLRMVQRYAHLSPGHLRASIEIAAPKKSDNFVTIDPAISCEDKGPQKRNPAISGEVSIASKMCPQRDSNPSYGLERAVSVPADSSIKRDSRRKTDDSTPSLLD